LAPYVEDVSQFAIDSNFQHQICEAGLAPRTLAEGEYQGQCNYAYHLDAGAFADLLKQHCKTKLGVQQRIGTVERCELTADGQIKALHLTDGSMPIEADLFIDCTGFASLLLGKALGVPFESVDHLLFNDSALAMQVPYDHPDAPIPCHTIATAQNAGWIWDIGLTHRRGVGHVYAAKFLSDDEAEFNLRRYIGKAAEGVAARKISFATGHRAKFWQHNCVAIGMSAGFVEPLEATAIMLVEISARFVADNLPADQATMPLVARRFNQQMLYRWQRILDFLKLHYMLTKRPEPYWQAHLDPATIPQSLQDDLQLWQHRGPQIQDFHGSLELFPAASYQYVLYGMGFKPDFSAQAYLHQQHAQAQQIIRRNQQLTAQMLQTLPPHRDYIHRWLAATRGH
jgi:tryptophan halogenase